MDKIFDIVIPIGPHDTGFMEKVIEAAKKNIIGYRNIYLVSFDPNIHVQGCITVDEQIFPFNKQTVISYLGENDRNGWYLQQLLKLYAGLVIKDILINYLVIDADTYFLKPVQFFDNCIPLYNVGSEYVIPYFNHMNRLHPSLKKQNRFSGICHHMMFQTPIVMKLIQLVEEFHGEPFYVCFLKCVDKDHILGAGASEYEIYFNYLHTYHQGRFVIRPLRWKNTHELVNTVGFDYITYHWYMRQG